MRLSDMKYTTITNDLMITLGANTTITEESAEVQKSFLKKDQETFSLVKIADMSDIPRHKNIGIFKVLFTYSVKCSNNPIGNVTNLDVLGVVRAIEDIKYTTTFPSSPYRNVFIIDNDTSQDSPEGRQIRLIIYGPLVNDDWTNQIGKVIAIQNARMQISTQGGIFLSFTSSGSGKFIPSIFFDPRETCPQIANEITSLQNWYDQFGIHFSSQEEHPEVENIISVSNLHQPSSLLGSSDGGDAVTVIATIARIFAMPTSSQALWVKACNVCSSQLEQNNAGSLNCHTCNKSYVSTEFELSYKFFMNIVDTAVPNVTQRVSMLDNALGAIILGTSATTLQKMHIYARTPIIEKSLQFKLYKMKLNVHNSSSKDGSRHVVLVDISLVSDSTPASLPPQINYPSRHTPITGNIIPYY